MALLYFLTLYCTCIGLIKADELYQGSVVSDGSLKNSADDDQQCSHHMHKFYRKMKCEPETTPGSKCPTSYKCATLLKRSPDHCYHEGLMYPVGANITRDKVDFHSPCIQSCQCVRLYEGVRFVCTQRVVPENNCSAPKGCKHFPFVEDFPCCQVGVTSCNQGKLDSLKCMFDGRSYSEGEKIITGEDPTCTQCICASGFNGTVSPKYCRQLTCAIEFWGDAPVMLTRGCIPLYMEENGCCPISFRCPAPEDRVIKSNTPRSDHKNTEKKCFFGNLTMDIGDTLTPWKLPRPKDVECSCTIPPLPSCVRKDFIMPEVMRRELAREGLDGRSTEE